MILMRHETRRVWLINFDPQTGAEIKHQRPAVIVEREPFTRLRRTVAVVPLSASHTQTEFPLLIATRFMNRDGVAVIDQLKACDEGRFGQKVGSLSEVEMAQISRALTDLLDLV